MKNKYTYDVLLTVEESMNFCDFNVAAKRLLVSIKVYNLGLLFLFQNNDSQSKTLDSIYRNIYILDLIACEKGLQRKYNMITYPNYQLHLWIS